MAAGLFCVSPSPGCAPHGACELKWIGGCIAPGRGAPSCAPHGACELKCKAVMSVVMGVALRPAWGV